MPRPVSSQPTEVELQILRVLWERGPSTVRPIHEALAADKSTNYSTTVKMLSVMLDKGLVNRDERVRPLVYRAAKNQQTTQRGMLRDLIQRAYDGSAASLVLQALSTQRATPEELAEIRRMLDGLDEGELR
jgi:predicted transcriptional regulator